jgi:hypothetical protein
MLEGPGNTNETGVYTRGATDGSQEARINTGREAEGVHDGLSMEVPGEKPSSGFESPYKAVDAAVADHYRGDRKMASVDAEALEKLLASQGQYLDASAIRSYLRGN